MWFKQVQIFQLKNSKPYSVEKLASQLEELAFQPCFPSMPSSIGWAAPVDEDDEPLVLAVSGYLLICMQIEEKILPSIVIRQELMDKIKQIELQEARKVRQKEKLRLKDELMLTLLPRAFTKITRYYAYIDPKNNHLILNTTNAKKVEMLVSLFKKATGDDVAPFGLKKLSPVVTHWLKHQQYPTEFAIEKACVLQDPGQQHRVIRCQEQNLFASSIQDLLKDGCEVKQIALSWRDRLNFNFVPDDFTLRSLQYQEEMVAQANEMEAETKKQQMIADFFIMTAAMTELVSDLKDVFSVEASHVTDSVEEVA